MSHHLVHTQSAKRHIDCGCRQKLFTEVTATLTASCHARMTLLVFLQALQRKVCFMVHPLPKALKSAETLFC